MPGASGSTTAREGRACSPGAALVTRRISGEMAVTVTMRPSRVVVLMVVAALTVAAPAPIAAVSMSSFFSIVCDSKLCGPVGRLMFFGQES